MPYFEPQQAGRSGRCRFPRRDFGRDDALVDADDALFERLGDPPDAADVTSVNTVGSKKVPPSALRLPR